MSGTWTLRAAICCAVAGAVLPAPLSGAATLPPVDLVRDVNATPVPSQPAELTAVGATTLFYVVSMPGVGKELWRSDGTAGDATLVKDINPGEADSDPGGLVDIDGTLYFRADDGEHGVELWMSDGTAAGTVMLKDINPRGDSGADGMMEMNGEVFFAADDGTHGNELWKTNGTDAGTALVAEVNQQTTEGLTGSGVWNLTEFGGRLYFTATDGFNASGQYGEELWSTDGTAAGTSLVRDIWPGSAGSQIAGLTVADVAGPEGPALFFRAADEVHGPRLWRSDGTGSGTGPVADTELDGSGLSPIVDVGGTLYFAAGGHDSELWSSDGTAAGTTLVADLNPGADGSLPRHLTEFGGTLLFFVTQHNDPGLVGLWTSDGTETGTTPVTSGETICECQSVGRLAGTLLFDADTDADAGEDGAELWTTDGESASLLADIRSGPQGSLPDEFTSLNDVVYFFADDGVAGDALWTSDGTANGTAMVVDLSAATDRSLPEELTAVGRSIFFVADDGRNGTELWRSDGTETGTKLVKDIVPGPDGSSPAQLTAVGNLLFFTAQTNPDGTELWRSDGTAGGTLRVRDVEPGFGTSPSELTAVGSTLFFTIATGIIGTELWKSDGTSDGTVLVDDITPNTAFAIGSSNPRQLTDVAGSLYFTAWTTSAGRELWKSDGSGAGTTLVADLNPAVTPAGPGNVGGPIGLSAVGDALYFTADDGSSGRQLWKHEAGATGPLTDVVGGAFPELVTAVGDQVFFRAADADHGVELWLSDGTLTGTDMVADLVAGPTGSNPSDLTRVGGTILFTADDGVLGRELWKSDGVGVELVKDVNPSGDGFADFALFGAGGLLLMAANDGADGAELWQSDGTEDGTVLVEDIRPGSGDGVDSLLTAVASGGRVFFSADDGAYGRELWAAAVDAAPPVVTVTFSPPVSGWYTAASATGTVSADDSGTGGVVVGISCTGATVGSINGLSTPAASATIAVAAQGSIAVTCTAVDAAGNSGAAAGSVNSATVQHDSIAPWVNIVGGQAPLDGQLAAQSISAFPVTVGASPVAVNGTAGDGGSGLASVTVNGSAVIVASGAWNASGLALAAASNTITAVATDIAGNSASAPVTVALSRDLDGDRIANNVDTSPRTASTGFSDVGLTSGKTSGTVLSVPTGATISVVDSPTGVLLTFTTVAPNDRVRVQIDGRPSSEKLPAGVYDLTDPVWDTTLSVLEGGPAEIEAPLNGSVVTVTVGEGAAVTFTETVSASGALTDLAVQPAADNPIGSVQLNGVDLVAGQEMTLGALNAKLAVADGTFVLAGTFAPGASGDRTLLPSAEPVVLRIGAYAMPLPAGSFARTTDGAYSFTGSSGGIKLSMLLKAAKRGTWDVKATGKTVRGLTSPVAVTIRVGDDQAVKAVPMR